jgi:peroxiredoxin
MRAKPVLLLIVVLSIMSLAATDEENSTLTKVGDAVPQFTIQTIDGQTLTPQSLKGKVVLINFFATWCGPCNEEMPHLQKVSQEITDKRFVMVSVGREHQPDEVKKFAQDKKLSFSFAADPKRDVYKLFATQFIPRNYVIDSNGKIVFQSVGFTEEELGRMTQAIKKSLEQAPGATQ